MNTDYSQGLTLNDLDNLIDDIGRIQDQEFHMIMGFKMAWLVGGKKFNYQVVRRKGKARLIKQKYIGSMPTTKYLK